MGGIYCLGGIYRLGGRVFAVMVEGLRMGALGQGFGVEDLVRSGFGVQGLG